MLHTATLMHDDVADYASMRRGILSVSAMFSAPAAVLTGDFWLARSLNLLVDRCDKQIVLNFSEAIRKMSEGELLQLDKADKLDTDEDDYFSRRIFEDISAIAKDIKQSHHRDTETGDENNPLTDVIDVVKEFAMATDPMKATLSTLSKQLGMNFNKMDPAEVQFFTTLIEKYSTSYRSMLPKKGRGKK